MGYERHDSRRWRGQDEASRNDYRNREGRRDAPRGYDYEDRGFFERAGDELRSWFGDDEAERRRRIDEREYEQSYGARDRDYGRNRGYPGYDRGSPGGYGYGAGGAAGYSPYTGGTYRESNVDSHDPRYHEWRNREIANLDRDYDEYRREHQSRFEQDFGSWRKTRQGQRQYLNSVQEHQEVVGSDGSHIGTVDHVRGDRILLTKTDQDAGGHHHSVPCSWINRVTDKVELSRTADETKAAWKDEERRSAIGGYGDSDGPHVLNRSFSGTY
jgi:hypothetical protein